MFYAHRLTSWFIPRSVTLAVVALAAAFFVAVLAPAAHAQQPGQRPDFKVTAATFDGRNLHVEYINATGIGYPRIRYEVGFQWYDAAGQPIGIRHWLPIPEVERGGVSILDNKYRIELSYRRGGIYGRTLAQFIEERPQSATQLRVTVDDGDRIAEEDEKNNVAVLTVPLPDLVIRHEVLQDNLLTLTYGNDTTSYIRDWFRIAFQWVDKDGAPIGQEVYTNIARMDPTEERKFSSKGETVISGPTYRPVYQSFNAFLRDRATGAETLRIMIDSRNSILESNEGNNVVRVLPSRPPPDLVVERIAIVDGQPQATVWNQGKGPARSVVVAHEYRDRAGKRLDGGSRETAPLGLGPDQKIIAAILGTVPDAAVTVRVIVDPANAVAESDEQNNVKEVPAPMADLAIADAKIADGTLAFTYRNSGTLKSGPISIWLHFANAQGAQIGPLFWMDVSPLRASGTQVLANETAFAMSSTGQVELTALLAAPPAGATHLKVLLDGPDRVVEANEGNNAVLLTMPVIPIPDLTVSDLKLGKDAITWKEKNLGDTVFGDFTYLTTIAWLDVSGKTLSERGPQTATVEIRAGSSSTEEMSTRFGAPASFLTPPAGAAKLRATIDPKGTVTEKDETNNVVEIVVPLPDLTVSDLKLGKDAITWKEKNLGDTVFGDFTYLTTIAWLDVSGKTLSERGPQTATVELRAGSSSTEEMSTRFGAPASFLTPPAGAMKLRATVDAKGTVVEKDETNNSVEIKVEAKPELPDLAFTNVFLVPPKRERLVIGFQNAGKAAAPEFPWAMAWVDAAGGRLGTPYEGIGLALKPNWRFGASSDMGDPKGKPMPIGKWLAEVRPDGAMQLEIIIDPENRIAESDEANNRHTFAEWSPPKPAEPEKPALPPLSKLPDLTITDATLDTAALRFWYHNRGESVTGPTISLWYEMVDAQEKRVGGFRWINLNAAMQPRSKQQGNQLLDFATLDSERGKITLGDFVNGAPPSATHLRITIDGPNAHAEANEQNNSVLLPRPSVPKPDAAKPDLALRDAKLADGKLRVTVVNLGKGSAERVMWQFAWLGTDGTELATSDVEAAVGTLKSGASYPVELPIANARAFGIFRFLQDIPAGAIALRIAVDPKDAIAEVDERNNTARIEFVIPDLALGTVESRDGALRIEVKNLGTKESSATDIWLMWFGAKGSLSSSAAVDLPAIAVGSTTTVNVPLDGKTEASQILREPPKDGTRLRVFLDGSRKVGEINEQNNDRMVDRAVFPKAAEPEKPEKPDLVPEGLKVGPTSPTEGAMLDFSAVVRNKGTGKADASVAWFIVDFDRDDEPDVSPELDDVKALAPNTTQAITWEDAVEAQAGTHAVEFCVDVEEAVDESNEDNNCVTRTFTVGGSPMSIGPSQTRSVVSPFRSILGAILSGFATPIVAGSPTEFGDGGGW